jgi:2-polyprenyl-3-methyl-5-hydroxy-6-metoxy-1,4-benzoquinol methylase
MSQDKIWDYYQTTGTEVFSDAWVRLDFLFRRAFSLAEGRRIAVLNIGIGNGWLERRCASAGWATHALDPSQEAINALEAGITGKVGYIQSVPYEGNVFDVVFCSEVIEHLSEQEAKEGLREVYRVLSPGGDIIGTVPYRENLAENFAMCPDCGKVFHRWGHQQSFDRGRMRGVLQEAGFKVVEMKTSAFLNFQRGSLKNRMGLLFHWTLGRLGLTIGNPVLYFRARKD